VKFLEGEGACAAVGGEIGRERGDASEEVLGAGLEIEGNRFLRLSAARRRRLGKVAPGIGLFRILGHKKDGVAVFGFCSGHPLERLFLGVTAGFGAFLRLGGVMIPGSGVWQFLGGFSVGGLVG
jgi:hypothetical protein